MGMEQKIDSESKWANKGGMNVKIAGGAMGSHGGLAGHVIYVRWRRRRTRPGRHVCEGDCFSQVDR